MERGYNVEKIDIGCFSWMLERLLRKVRFRYNAWIKQNKTKHLHHIWTIIYKPFLQDVPYKLGNIPETSHFVPPVKMRHRGAEALYNQTVQIKLKILMIKQLLLNSQIVC